MAFFLNTSVDQFVFIIAQKNRTMLFCRIILNSYSGEAVFSLRGCQLSVRSEAGARGVLLFTCRYGFCG